MIHLRETPGGIQHPDGKRIKATGNGVENGHFTNGLAGHQDHKADEEEIDEEGTGTALGERTAAADKKAGADGAADRDHLLWSQS